MRADILLEKLCCLKRSRALFKYGLTFVELLVILSCILFIMAFFMPALRNKPDSPTRVICSNNVRQLLIGYTLYGGENNNNLPLQPDTYTLNEMSKETLEALMSCIGYDLKEFRANNQGDLPPQQIFYCPTNILQKRHMANFWNASDDYRALGYFFIIDSKNGRDKIKGSGDKIWLKTLNIKNSAEKELIIDMLICDKINYKPPKYPNGNFTKCPSKILGFETSSHLKDEKGPSGGNIGFVDGHVEWRYFKDMDKRYGQNPVCWW